MVGKNLLERVVRLEHDAGASAPAQFDSAAWDRFKGTLDGLYVRRDALLKAREALPRERRLALARQDHAAALERAGCPAYAVWGYGLKVRSLEIAMLERDGLARDERLIELREGCKRLQAPFAPLPVAINVEPVPDEEMRRLEREIDDWIAQHRELRDASGREPWRIGSCLVE
ncbi:hypothetical protein LLG90_08230 [Aromatoleum toluclasticum]|uniref:hypothetical protein n=1 Tax=Aromatoleum toluclasticum TaxID=92003 RepID=UPI001D18341C|nr:hypothetical protein [Aromatoleum toluclasticum]MCC4115331.1 hypothetical protein [Aromatoleum toluclasticum]